MTRRSRHARSASTLTRTASTRLSETDSPCFARKYRPWRRFWDFDSQNWIARVEWVHCALQPGEALLRTAITDRGPGCHRVTAEIHDTPAAMPPSTDAWTGRARFTRASSTCTRHVVGGQSFGVRTNVIFNMRGGLTLRVCYLRSEQNYRLVDPPWFATAGTTISRRSQVATDYPEVFEVRRGCLNSVHPSSDEYTGCSHHHLTRCGITA
jgi:hypothetical protein